MSDEEIAEVERLERVDDVVEARESAWVAEIESYSDPRSAENPDLLETLAGRKLLATVDDILWSDLDTVYRIARVSEGQRDVGYEALDVKYDDWSVDVQSVVFPNDDVAWLETCISYQWEHADPESGEVIFEPRVSIQQLTEELWLTEDGWKLALSMPNFSSQDDNAECPIGDGAPVSDDEIMSLRDDAEQQYVEALIAASHDDLSSYSGVVSKAIMSWGIPPRFAPDYYCPRFPSIIWHRNREKVPSFYRDAWHAVYTGSYKPVPEPEMLPRNVENFLQPDARRAECVDHYWIAHNAIPVPTDTEERSVTLDRHDESTSSSVVVDEIIRSDDLPVVYMTTCRELHFSDTSYGTPVSDYGPGDAVVYSTESMRVEDGSWVLTGRWNISVSEDVDSGCAF